MAGQIPAEAEERILHGLQAIAGEHTALCLKWLFLDKVLGCQDAGPNHAQCRSMCNRIIRALPPKCRAALERTRDALACQGHDLPSAAQYLLRRSVFLLGHVCEHGGAHACDALYELATALCSVDSQHLRGRTVDTDRRAFIQEVKPCLANVLEPGTHPQLLQQNLTDYIEYEDPGETRTHSGVDVGA